ncbi:MAG TPA: xylose isomerase, partial [Chloroflexi bacterium]|nr:xylose isomerase [Chloroflexota bacterium]
WTTAQAEALRNGRLVAETGGRYLVLSETGDERRRAGAGRVTPKMGLTDEQWAVAGEGANFIARAVRDELGLETVFHHHVGTFVETPDEVARIMAATDPELVGLCLDTGHYAFGGGNPREALRRYGQRVRYLHFKDVSAARLAEARARGLSFHEAVAAGVFTELGQGVVDFPGLLADLAAHNYEGWACVEQDIVPGGGIIPLDSAVRSREYLRLLGL